MKSPSKPKENPEAAVLRARQISDLAKLDEQENVKIKRMMNAARGSRMFRGSPSTRTAPGNSAGAPLYSPRGSSGGGSSGGGAAGSGGGGSNRSRTGIRAY